MAVNSRSLLLKIFLPLALCLGLGAWYLLSPAKREALVARAHSGTAVNAVAGTVVVQAEESRDIKSEVSGRVSEIAMKLDKEVAEGEVLLRLDTGDLDLRIERTRNELAAAQARLKLGGTVDAELGNARDTLVEILRQQEKGLVSEAEVSRLRRNLQALEQRRDKEELDRSLAVQILENEAQGLVREKEKMTLRAPFSGIIAQLDTGMGDLISAGQPIARLISNRRYIEGRLSEENFAGVAVDQRAKVSLLPYGTRSFDAKVVKVLSTSDPETQRYLVHLELDEGQLPVSKLITGITGDVSIILDERPAKTLVPRRAFMGGKVRVVENGRIRTIPVSVGFVSLSAVEIIDGLQGGELVVVEDTDSFSDGQKVEYRLTDDPRWR